MQPLPPSTFPGCAAPFTRCAGALSHLAAGAAVAMAQEMEEFARQQNLDQAVAIWPRLEAELDGLTPVLEEFAKQPC